jgi:hypothetical protein
MCALQLVDFRHGQPSARTDFLTTKPRLEVIANKPHMLAADQRKRCKIKPDLGGFFGAKEISGLGRWRMANRLSTAWEDAAGLPA